MWTLLFRGKRNNYIDIAAQNAKTCAQNLRRCQSIILKRERDTYPAEANKARRGETLEEELIKWWTL